MGQPLGAGFGEAHRAAQIAVFGNLDQRQAGMLHVIGAQAAIVRATISHFGIETLGHFRRLHVHLARQLVPGCIVADQHPLGAVRRAPFFQKDRAILDKYLGFDGMQAGRAYGGGRVVKEIGAILAAHDSAFRGNNRIPRQLETTRGR